MSLPKLFCKITRSLYIRELGSVAGNGKPRLTTQAMAEGDKCIFCKIVSGKDEKTLLLYQVVALLGSSTEVYVLDGIG